MINQHEHFMRRALELAGTPQGLDQLNVETWVLPAMARDQVDLISLLAELGQRNILGLVVEGGGKS